MAQQEAVIDFYRYPSIGQEDWRYAYATARVRVLQTQMLSRGTFLDMANADSFTTALELLGGSEYAMSQAVTSLTQIEKMLLERRSSVRDLFVYLMLDEGIVELLRAREDFANMRLAVRRVVTEKPIGNDYSDHGSVRAEEFEEIFEQESYDRFPVYLAEGVEAAVLGYYENKDIRQIDYGIDRIQAEYKIKKAEELGSVFLLSLFRTQIDMTNIRTMLRLKLAERDEKQFFLQGGYVGIDRLTHALGIGYEAIAPLFYSTSYYDILERGIPYLTSEKSFLRLEKECEDHMMGFLKTTNSLAAGSQPVIAFSLMKENEIRTVRMLLTCKMNALDTKLILDRLGEN